MKRDMDIIRLILLQLEGDEKARAKLKTYPEKDVVYNAALLIDEEFVEGGVVRNHQNEPMNVVTNHMTWKGHDFLDAARDENLWNRAKEKFVKPGASFTFELLKEWLKAEIKKHTGLGS